MFETGLFVALGLIVWLMKCGWKWRMRVFSNPLTVDIIVFISLTIIHWGTFSGVMAATIGALLVSVILSAARFTFGHITNGVYVKGKVADLTHILRAEKVI